MVDCDRRGAAKVGLLHFGLFGVLSVRNSRVTGGINIDHLSVWHLIVHC